MKKSKDYRGIAWAALKRDWGTAILAYVLVSSAIVMASSTGVGGIIISGTLMVGLSTVYLAYIRNTSTNLADIVKPFSAYLTQSMLLGIVNTLLIALGTLLFIIPGIILKYAYSMSYFIMADNPTISQTEARQKSSEMMKGNKWRLFCLDFSYIGWGLLCVLTGGILVFIVGPAMKMAYAAFYEDLAVADVRVIDSSTDETVF